MNLILIIKRQALMKKNREICGCHGVCTKHILNEEKYFCIEDMGVDTKRSQYTIRRRIATAMAIVLGILIILS